jgi:hypothetical protein
MDSASPRHAAWLTGLAVVFALRVLAQPLATLPGWDWLPAFEVWHSGALPYAWLLTAQLVLLGWMLVTAARVRRGVATRSRRRGRLIAALAAVYGAVMGARLVLGSTWFRGHWWLDAPLPTVFHLGLTTFLAVTAHYHFREHPTSSAHP